MSNGIEQVQKMEGAPIFITKHSPAFWRITLNNPPINLMSPENDYRPSKIDGHPGSR